MNKFSRYLCCILVMPLLNCFYNEEKGCTEAPLWCNSREPTSGIVEVRISTKYLDDNTNVLLYSGKIEEGKPFKTYHQTSEVSTHNMSNGYISASVKYNVVVNGKLSTVTSVDGGTLESTNSSRYCDNVICYEEGKLKLDLRLDESLIR